MAYINKSRLKGYTAYRNAIESMKKLTAFLCAALLLMSLTGCEYRKLSDSVVVMSQYSGNEFVFPIKNYSYYDPKHELGSYFETNENLLAVKKAAYDALSSPSTISASNSDIEEADWNGDIFYEGVNGFALGRNNKDGTIDYFYLRLTEQKTESRSKWQYLLKPMEVSLMYDVSSSPVSVMLPLHLISDLRLIDARDAQIYAGVQYELNENVDINSFLDFYESSGWYNVSCDGERIDILSFCKDPVRSANRITSISFPVYINFFEHLGMMYFSISLTT